MMVGGREEFGTETGIGERGSKGRGMEISDELGGDNIGVGVDVDVDVGVGLSGGGVTSDVGVGAGVGGERIGADVITGVRGGGIAEYFKREVVRIPFGVDFLKGVEGDNDINGGKSEETFFIN
jgi:hypothetical protein